MFRMFDPSDEINGIIHPFGNAYFYTITLTGMDGTKTRIDGKLIDFDIYVDTLYQCYIWLRQRLVRNVSVDFES